MKPLLLSSLCLGTFLTASAGFAAESTAPATASPTTQQEKRQMMHDCMDQMKATKPDETHAQWKAACMSKMTSGVVNDGVLTKRMKQAQP
jgi:hypothetical protein